MRIYLSGKITGLEKEEYTRQFAKAEAFGIADESYCGVCSKYITFQDDSDYGTDDIVFWLEVPPTPKLDKLEIYKEDKIKDAIRDYRKQFLKEIEK